MVAAFAKFLPPAVLCTLLWQTLVALTAVVQRFSISCDGVTRLNTLKKEINEFFEVFLGVFGSFLEVFFQRRLRVEVLRTVTREIIEQNDAF